jgi:hypothetical protein
MPSLVGNDDDVAPVPTSDDDVAPTGATDDVAPTGANDEVSFPSKGAFWFATQLTVPTGALPRRIRTRCHRS